MVKSRSSLIESSRVDRTAATEPDESNALWPISSRAHLLPIGPLCSPSTNAYFTVAHAHGFHERAHSTKMQHRRAHLRRSPCWMVSLTGAKVHCMIDFNGIAIIKLTRLELN